VALLRGELAAPPFDRPNPGIQLFWHVGVQHEIIKAARRLDSSHLAHGDRDQCSHVVERLFLSHGPQRGDGQVRSIQCFE
jgi:hypothetical protein